MSSNSLPGRRDPGRRLAASAGAVLGASGLLAPDAALTPLGGGRSNLVWKFSAGDDDLVAKLFLAGGANQLFPNDATAEWSCLRRLRGTGIAPDPVARLSAGGHPLLVYRHIAGPHGFAEPEQVATLLRKLHATPAPLPDLRRTAASPLALKTTGRAILDLCPGSDADRLRRLEPPAPDADHPPPTACLIHGDVTPGNLVLGPGGLRLIDWQCPAIGDPVEDIALFLSPAMQTVHGAGPLSRAQRAAFLEALADSNSAARYAGLAPLFHWRMAAYCLWKQAQGDASYRAGYAAETQALDACLSEQR